MNDTLEKKFKKYGAFELFIFEIDNVIFPRKDYVLQVYYLFCAFIEYVETEPMAQDMLQFMKTVYETAGEEKIFDKIQKQFSIPEKYREKFDSLFTNARLPLKLELYHFIFEWMTYIFKTQKKMWIVTSGVLEEQINKIKQIEWHGLQEHIKVYFSPRDFEGKKLYIKKLIEEHAVSMQAVVSVISDGEDAKIAQNLQMNYVFADQV